MTQILMRMWVVLALLFGGACEEKTDDPPPVKKKRYFVSDGAIKDQDDHVIFLRGINISNRAKSTEDHLVDITEEDIQMLKDGGMNMVRLLTFWKAIAPEGPDEFDQVYIDQFVDRVHSLTSQGFYVVVDMHQDLWGVPFVNHGAPAWACPDDLKEGYEAQSPWWANYTSTQVSGCFDYFWESFDKWKAFAQAWAQIAAAVCHDDKVVGFDLLNEPHTGTTHMTFDFDNEVLFPFYEETMKAIDVVCPNRIYFLEPGSLGTLGLGDPLIIPSAHRDQVVYAGHFYPPYVHEPDGGGYDGDKEALRTLFMDRFSSFVDEGIPIWVGEYGGFTTSSLFDGYVQDLNEIMIEHGIQTAWWDYSMAESGFAFYDEAGSVKSVFKNVYGAPYPTRLPNIPTFQPDLDHQSIDLTFDCRPDGQMEIALPKESCACSASGGIKESGVKDQRFQALCAGEESVTLTCGCAP